MPAILTVNAWYVDIFSKILINYSDPIFVDENLSFDETSTIITDCENQLNKLQKEAFALC